MASVPRDFDEHHFYHIYNCGVEKRVTFTCARDLNRFIETINFYQYPQSTKLSLFTSFTNEAKQFYLAQNPQRESTRRIGIIAYCLMPNHFHLLLRQKNQDGISKFMAELSDSYTKYFNLKYVRIGALFQGSFKSKTISTEESLLQVSRYIHLNPLNSTKTNPSKDITIEDYPYSSYQNWVGTNLHLSGVNIDNDGVNKAISIAGGRKKYREFAEARIGKDPTLEISDLILEKPDIP